MKKQVRANILLLITAIVWGFAFVAQVKASSIGSFLFNGIRYLLGALVLVPVLILLERKKITRAILKKTAIGSLICSVIMFFAVNLQQYGIILNKNAGKAGFITGLYIVFVPVAGIVLKKQSNRGARLWISVVMALVGLFLVCIPLGSSFDQNEILGDILILLCAFFWTAHIHCVDRYAKEECPLLFTVLQFAFCGLLCMVVAIFADDISWRIIYDAGLPILYGGLVSVGVGYTLQVLGQRDAQPTVATIAMSCEAVFAAIGGVLLLDEVMTVRQIIGAALMLFSIFLAQFGAPNKEANEKN